MHKVGYPLEKIIPYEYCVESYVYCINHHNWLCMLKKIDDLWVFVKYGHTQNYDIKNLKGDVFEKVVMESVCGRTHKEALENARNAGFATYCFMSIEEWEREASALLNQFLEKKSEEIMLTQAYELKHK